MQTNTHEEELQYPPNWPKYISIRKTTFKNWAETLIVPNVWSTSPKTSEEVVAVVNWASNNGFKVRASGSKHCWVPLIISADDDAGKTILLETKDHLNNMKMDSKEDGFASVWTEAGAELESLLSFLEENGYGFTATPLTGGLSVGGMLAIGAHGHGIPARGEKRQPGHGYGSLSNMVVSFRAVVWDYSESEYVLRRFDRTHPNASAFLTNLGRTIITDVTFRVGTNQNLRCESITDVPADELFAEEPAMSDRSFANLLDKCGRLDVFIFPLTNFAWVKMFTVADKKPETSRRVDAPYNYECPDMDPSVIEKFVDIKTRLLDGDWSLAEEFLTSTFSIISNAIKQVSSTDIWGPSKNLFLNVLSSYDKVILNGFVILTERKNIQNVINSLHSFYVNLLVLYQSQDKYPLNNLTQIRVSGLDNAEDVMVPGAKPPSLSPLQPSSRFPEFDVAVWFNMYTFPQTPFASEFYARFEFFISENFRPPYALVRKEWAKGWAYTDECPWGDRSVLEELRSSYELWDTAKSIFKHYDKNDVFYNKFEELLFDS